MKGATHYLPLDGMIDNVSLETLPPPDTKRWVPRRKAIVLAALRLGLLRIDEACERYGLSADELLSWQKLVEQHGITALRTTRLQAYRCSNKQAASGEAKDSSIDFPEKEVDWAGA